ncbi:glycosyl transferase family group 2-domain-containing protein [Podospora australis]|uniref:Glycosyl transferase family group 2-domain-containing protein n=1 Tax=Podospora australis TaxID=1536484 RepID=A0AAN7AJB8_9PEZI|nr:glycosyl transferase family group 2-domain-containing protein [Podospora australis]
MRCTPSLSTLAIIFLLVALSEAFFIFYTIFLHIILTTIPLRVFRGATLAARHIEAARKASQQEFNDQPDTRESNSSHPSCSSSEVIHVSIIPSYKESLETLQDTLSILASHRSAKTTYDIFLAMEERDPGAMEIAEALISRFGTSFFCIQYSVHPSDVPGESQGKSANVAWAARAVEDKYKGRPCFQDVLITITDSDTHLLESYYQLLQQRHSALREQQPSDPAAASETLYTAPIIFDRNAHLVPRLVRVADVGWSSAGLACYKTRTDYGGIAFPTSVYSLPLSLVSSVGGWDAGPGAIGEDMHMMLKCYFATGGQLNIESIASPASMSNVTTPGSTGLSGWLRNHKARYLQALRHMWGCLDTGYAVQKWSEMKYGNRRRVHFLWLRNAVLFLRLFEAHILPLHFLCILVASSRYSSSGSMGSTTRTTSPYYLEMTLLLTEYVRNANLLLMAICLNTAYARFYHVSVQTRRWEMQKAGLHDFATESSPGRNKSWSLGAILDILALPAASMLFGTLPLLHAVLSQLWSDRLVYRVSGKPTKSKGG